MNVYLAGPLYSEPEQRWCKFVKFALENITGIDVTWPFDSVEKSGIMAQEDLEPSEVQEAIASVCIEDIEKCDIFVILLDTIPTDDGTAFELGYVAALNSVDPSDPIAVFGLRTDVIREYNDAGAPLNSMIGAHVDRLCPSIEDLLETVAAYAELKS